jgi:hypothetical protein
LLEAVMNKHTSCPPRTLATLSGYLRICEELEAENRALRLQNVQMRAQLSRRMTPAADILDAADENGLRADAQCAERLRWTRLM